MREWEGHDQKIGKGKILMIVNLFFFVFELILIVLNLFLHGNAAEFKPFIFGMIFLVNIFFFVRFIKTFKIKITSILVSIIFLVLCYFQIVVFIHALRNHLPNDPVVRLPHVTGLQILSVFLVPLPVAARLLKNKLVVFDNSIEEIGGRIFVMSVLLWAGVVFVYSPLTVFTSSWMEFNISILQLMPWLFLYFLGFILFMYILRRVIPSELKTVLLWFMYVSAVLGWFYTYLLPGDFGHLDNFEFSNPVMLYNASRLFQLLEVGGVTAGVLILIYLMHKFPRKIFFAVTILNVMALGQTAANILFSGSLTAKIYRQEKNPVTDPPGYAAKLLSFSKEQNVLIIMLDMFCGGFIPEILEKNPDIEECLSGFVWYDNTLSTSNVTFGSVPSIVGGMEFTVDNTERQKGSTLEGRIRKAYRFYPGFFGGQSFAIAFADPSYLWATDLETDKDIIVGKSKDFVPYWLCHEKKENLGGILITPAQYSRIFSAIGVFKGSPFLLKPKIYRKGRWLKMNSLNVKVRHAVENLALLDSVPDLSNTDSPQKTFKYICSEITHLPWCIDSSGKISRKVVSDIPLYKSYPGLNMMFYNPSLPYYTYVRTLRILGKWFKWMKKAGIYDNTRIIVVSDHGYSGIDPMFGDYKVIRDKNGKLVETTGRVHPLLLVKNFKSRGPVKRSDRFMTNSDTPAIASTGIASSNPFPDPFALKAERKKLVVNFVPSRPVENDKYTYKIMGQYRVKDSIFNKSNWAIINK